MLKMIVCIIKLTLQNCKTKWKTNGKNTGDMVGASKITYALIWQFSNTEK